MSVPASDYKTQYVLTSAAQALAIPFYFIATSHVRVVRTRTHVDTVLTGGYSITGAGVEAGGTLTLDGTQTATGDRITIKRNVPLTQLIEYASNERFPASTHERGLDEAAMRAQQAYELAERGLHYSEGEVINDQKKIPGLPSRGGRVLGFDSDGNVDMRLTVDALNTLVLANPVNALTDVADYGSTAEETTDAADYGST